MADTTANVTAGDGTLKCAVDDVGGGTLVQRVKPAIGASGTAVDVSAGSGINGTGVQRVTIATDQTTITTQLPAALGSAVAASSLGVTASTEDIARAGIVTETAPASDTASSGQNGRLQRIAQRITSLIALFPSAIGRTTMAGSLSVTTASDDALTGILTETAPASDTASSGLNGRLQRIAQNITTLIAGLAATNTQLPTTPSGSVSVNITRPANVTAYTANDVLGGAITIATGMTSGERVMIAGVDLMPQIAAIPTGMTTFRLYLYSVTPPSALADNAAWDLPSGDRASFLGYVDIGAPVDLGSTLFAQIDNVNKELQMSGSASVFGYLVTAGGFTPNANSEVYQLRVSLLGL